MERQFFFYETVRNNLNWSWIQFSQIDCIVMCQQLKMSLSQNTKLWDDDFCLNKCKSQVQSKPALANHCKYARHICTNLGVGEASTSLLKPEPAPVDPGILNFCHPSLADAAGWRGGRSGGWQKGDGREALWGRGGHSWGQVEQAGGIKTQHLCWSLTQFLNRLGSRTLLEFVLQISQWHRSK